MFSYIGGKSTIGKWIKNYIPTNIETYVEPFSGAFWVYFNLDLEKFINLKTVVYNDFNILNSNLFSCIKNTESFYDFLKSIPAQEKERFLQYQSTVFNKNISIPDFQSGLEYIYVLTQVFSGTNPQKAGFVDLKGKYNSKFNSFRDKLINPKYIQKINKITNIENKDYSEIIDKYDSKNTFFYIDPPYYNCEKYYCNHEFGKESHKNLADKLQNIQGKFALSYYLFDDLLTWFPKDKFHWEEKQYSKISGNKLNTKSTIGTEILIMNY